MTGWASPLLAAQAEYLGHLGTAPPAEVREAPGLYAVRTGAASNTENGVVGTAAASEEAAVLVEWFRSTGTPASWLCQDSSLAATLGAAGCSPERGACEMSVRLAELDLGGTTARGLDVVRVESEGAVGTWFDLAAANRWFADSDERAPFERLYRELALRADARVVLYLARLDDEPAGFASAFYGSSSVLLTNVAVLPAARRRGVATELARVRLREAARRGCEVAVLAPSPDAVPLYTSLGFALHRSPPDRWYYLPGERS